MVRWIRSTQSSRQSGAFPFELSVRSSKFKVIVIYCIYIYQFSQIKTVLRYYCTVYTSALLYEICCPYQATTVAIQDCLDEGCSVEVHVRLISDVIS